MTRDGDGDPTLLTADDDARRLAIVFYRVRTSAYRITADCERMLEGLYQPERKAWRDAVGEALAASRHLLAIIARPADAIDVQQATQLIAALGARIQEPQRRIVDAMSSLLRFVPVSAEEELLLHDARTIRETGLDLLAFKESVLPSKARAGATDGHARGAIARGDARKPRVLVVDDDEQLRTLLQRLLNRLGYEVILAENGQLALDIAQRESPDLVLTDINMPELDGIELLRLLKGADGTRDIPVIVVSSQDDLKSVATCIEQGAEDHISKPYEPLLLQARVRASLERKRMRDLELEYLERVTELTAAAEAVERDVYVHGSLDALAGQDDELGRLARIFDRMVTGLKSREERLQHRLRQLRHEIGGTSSASRAASESAESQYASGEILAARYEILGQLGKGGMGMVYHARDRELQEEVAIKVVRRDLVAGDPTLVDRLKSEIRLTRRLSHRNVVRAHDLGEWKGTYFITMEYVAGQTLAELLDRRGRLTVESTLAIGTQLSEALAMAHEKDIIHRDIKPANLLVDGEGCLKVMDFGVARLAEPDANLTLGGFIVGTPAYMPPEQILGGKVSAMGDLFAAGVVLYECLAGRPPFVSDSVITLVSQMVEGGAPRLSSLAPDVPPALDALVHRLLQPHPADRVSSARELADKLSEMEHSNV